MFKELNVQVNNFEFDRDRFKIHLNNGKYITDCLSKDADISKYFNIAPFYETIIDLDNNIKFSFNTALKYETLSNKTFNPMHKQTDDELNEIYYIDNMIFRTFILWDLLAQICNIFWDTNLLSKDIYAFSFFNKLKDEHPMAEKIYCYFTEKENTEYNNESLKGNNGYVRDYRNRMTHRNSPNITTFSPDIQFRPPTKYIFVRVTEDYLKVRSFLNVILKEISDCYSKDYIISKLDLKELYN